MFVPTRERVLLRPAVLPPGVRLPSPVVSTAGLTEALEGLRRRLPEAAQLTLALRGPWGPDSLLARQYPLALLNAWPQVPGWFEHTALALDVHSTGTAADFCTALAIAAQRAALGLVLDLPPTGPHGASHDLDACTHSLRRMVMGLPAQSRPTLTLATRWLRSRDDARWAIEQGLSVRLVPGAAADPRQPQHDVGASVRTLARQLAGKVPHVTLVCPDPGAALDALGLLRKAGTACDLELGHDWPEGALRQVARRAGVQPRAYIAWAPPGFEPQRHVQSAH
jgi:hypothetical protein